MVAVVKVYKCDDVKVECGETNIFTITDGSGDEMALYKRDLSSLYLILSKMATDGMIEPPN